MAGEVATRLCSDAQAAILKQNEGKLVKVGNKTILIHPVKTELPSPLIQNATSLHEARIEHVARRAVGEPAATECTEIVVAIFLADIANFMSDYSGTDNEKT